MASRLALGRLRRQAPRSSYLRRVRFFDGAATYYRRFRPGYPTELIARLAAVTGLQRDRDRVLDMGAGTGQVAVPIAAYALEVVAVEPEPDMTHELVAHAPANVSVIQARVEDLGDELGLFALATSGRSFQWFNSDLVFDLLPRITPSLALLADDVANSEGQTAVLEIAREFAAARPSSRGAARRYSEILASSPFSDVRTITVEADRTWTVDQLIGFVYSTSLGVSLRQGPRRRAFEIAARERLRPSYRERVPVDAVVGRLPGDTRWSRPRFA